MRLFIQYIRYKFEFKTIFHFIRAKKAVHFKSMIKIRLFINFFKCQGHFELIYIPGSIQFQILRHSINFQIFKNFHSLVPERHEKSAEKAFLRLLYGLKKVQSQQLDESKMQLSLN